MTSSSLCALGGPPTKVLVPVYKLALPILLSCSISKILTLIMSLWVKIVLVA